MNHRTDVIEQDVATIKVVLEGVRSDLDDVRANYARREDVEALAVRTGALEQDMAVVRSNYARREDVQAILVRVATLEQKFDSELPHLATKAALQALRSEMRAWMAGTALSLLVATATLQFSFYQLLKTSMAEQVQLAVTAASKA
jgi:hypothetical protein